MGEMDWRDHGEVRQSGQASQVSDSPRQSTKTELRRYLQYLLLPYRSSTSLHFSRSACQCRHRACVSGLEVKSQSPLRI